MTVEVDCLEGMVAGRGKSDCQILANFAELSAVKMMAYSSLGDPELAAEGKGEVTVSRKAEVSGKRGEIGRAVSKSFD